MDGFSRIQPQTDVDCEVLKKAGFICDYDDFAFSATFHNPDKDFLDSEVSYLKPFISMRYEDGCIFSPRLNMKYTRYIESSNPELKTPLKNIFVKMCSDRYVINLEPITVKQNIFEYDYATIELGEIGLEMLRKISKKKYPAELRFAEEEFKLNDEQIETIQWFIEACDSSGISRQKHLRSIQSSCRQITQFNDW